MFLLGSISDDEMEVGQEKEVEVKQEKEDEVKQEKEDEAMDSFSNPDAWMKENALKRKVASSE